MCVTKDILHIGVNDHEIDLFEGQYQVPNGMAYNSYAIIDEKTAILDTVDARFQEEWLNHIREALGGKGDPDYLVVHHMEPDHSANILKFAQEYPDAKIVASAKAFAMMKNFFGTDFADRQVVVKEGDVLSLGNHSLTFITAPMVHWPEVIMSYDALEQVLFSADAFGKFGALDVDEPWTEEARRYYIGIVGKYGMPVQTVLKKAAQLPIQKICALHGPILEENLEYYLNLYHTWSSYQPEEEGILIAYASIYGNTKAAALELAEQLKQAFDGPVVTYDLARCDQAQAIADAFRYSKVILASSTYNGGLFPYMRSFIEGLMERGFSNHKVGLMENGSWAPSAAKEMMTMLERGKNLTFLEPTVRILSTLSEESRGQMKDFVAQILE
ncbi:MAG: FprA family A-type flavoprotein [Agathobacter sp.]|nr:FprA family A-type flavoprotein [Agathobacter sp.]